MNSADSSRSRGLRMKRIYVFWVMMMLISLDLGVNTKKQKPSNVHMLTDMKEYKKLLKSKTNVLILYMNDIQDSYPISEMVREAADISRGHATLAQINCMTPEGSKLCRRCKIGPERPFYLKHYKDGNYHKDYDRGLNVRSVVNFLQYPYGNIPWDEEPGSYVLHLRNGEALGRLLVRSMHANLRTMVMFYVSWCAHCHRIQPHYRTAARLLKNEAVLAAMEVSQAANAAVRHLYNITYFPTLLYFEAGRLQYPYDGEHTASDLVDFMRYPRPFMSKRPARSASWSDNTHIVQITAENFDETLKTAKAALVAFYKPRSEPSAELRPEFESAAAVLHTQRPEVILGAVDVTRHSSLAVRMDIRECPAVKYFADGRYKYEINARTQYEILEFLKDPRAPPPPPGSSEVTSVHQLYSTNFKDTLKKLNHALVMFYTPGCERCRAVWEQFVRASEQFKDEVTAGWCSVDCSEENELCSGQSIQYYPTLRLYTQYDRVPSRDYRGVSQERDYVSFMRAQIFAKDGKSASTASPKSNQEAGFGVNVMLLTDNNFEKVISEDPPCFVMFYATWCGHCSTAKPAFSKLATTLKTEGIARAVAIDAAENPHAADIGSVNELPTYILYVRGKQRATYDGDRSTDTMHTFLHDALQPRTDL